MHDAFVSLHRLDALPDPGDAHLTELAAAVTLVAIGEDDREARGARVLLEADDASAATNHGLMLHDHRDRHQGIEWLQRGAAGGDGLAASELARMARGEA